MIILICPKCNSKNVDYNESSTVFKCEDCGEVFTQQESDTQTLDIIGMQRKQIAFDKFTKTIDTLNELMEEDKDFAKDFFNNTSEISKLCSFEDLKLGEPNTSNKVNDIHNKTIEKYKSSRSI